MCSYQTRQRQGLFLEKGLKRIPGVLCPVHLTLRRVSGQIIIAEIGPFLVHNPFGHNFQTFIISIRLVKITLFAASEVSPAMRAGITPGYFVNNIDFFRTKRTLHYVPPVRYLFKQVNCPGTPSNQSDQEKPEPITFSQTDP